LWNLSGRRRRLTASRRADSPLKHPAAFAKVDKPPHSGKLRDSMRRLMSISGISFVLFIVWKVSLFLFTVQPIPANDAYFYDGAVVNALHGGKFANPTVAIARPYSGTELFSAYPPLYQGVLLCWMKVFGTSARSAVGLHVLLIALWAFLVYRTLRRLEIPPWAMHLAGGFLFVITFHDRPDSLAQVLGAGAVWATVAGLRGERGGGRLWVSAALLALVFCTSLQIGAMYSAVVGVMLLAHAWSGKERPAWLPLIVMGLTPFVLLAVGRFGFPQWWTGFVENAQDNPSASGLRSPQVDELLKLIRSLPGFLLVLLLALPALPRIRVGLPEIQRSQLALFLGTTVGTLAVCVLGLFYLTANYIPLFAAYLQPLAVGAGLVWLAATKSFYVPRAVVVGAGCACIALGGIRAVGMTTWGALCARDVTYADACRIVARELDASSSSASRTAVLSAAYLYGAGGLTNLNRIHSDYVVPLRGRATESDLVGLLALKPDRLLLTQFDYFRRYEPVLAELRQAHAEVDVRITNTAHVRAPEADRLTRKVVQHISWAPVIVEIAWPPAAEVK
jgi:hypothetical protein